MEEIKAFSDRAARRNRETEQRGGARRAMREAVRHGAATSTTQFVDERDAVCSWCSSFRLVFSQCFSLRSVPRRRISIDPRRRSIAISKAGRNQSGRLDRATLYPRVSLHSSSFSFFLWFFMSDYQRRSVDAPHFRREHFQSDRPRVYSAFLLSPRSIVAGSRSVASWRISLDRRERFIVAIVKHHPRANNSRWRILSYRSVILAIRSSIAIFSASRAKSRLVFAIPRVRVRPFGKWLYL